MVAVCGNINPRKLRLYPLTHRQSIYGRVLSDYNNQLNDDDRIILPLKLVSAKSQVVAGMRYELKFHAAQSRCPKQEVARLLRNKMMDLNDSVSADAWFNCVKVIGTKRYLYTLAATEVPWENLFEVELKSVENAGIVSY